jgi:hypothetical protein
LSDGKSLLESVKPDGTGAPADGHPATTATPPPKDARPARPDYLPENFWDGEKNEARVEDLAKAFTDLRGKIARGDHKAPDKPEGYKVPTPEGFAIAKDDKVLPAFLKAAHAQGLSQAQLDAVLKPVFSILQAMPKGNELNEQELDKLREDVAAAEMKKLGPQAPSIVKNIATWLNGLMRKGVIGPEEHNGVHAAMTSAEAVRGLSKIMAMTQPGIMPMADVAALGAGSLEDGHALLMDGYAKGGEATPEGRELLRKGREILASLDKAGALPAEAPLGLNVKRVATTTPALAPKR